MTASGQIAVAVDNWPRVGPVYESTRYTNRGGIPEGASMVMLNLSVTGATAPGFVTVLPCGTPVPLASNLNYEIGTTAANASLVKVPPNGSVCLYNSGATHLIVDFNGYLPV